MNTIRLLAMFVVVGGFSSCQSTAPTTPPIKASMITSDARQHVDAAVLASGRSLFVGRCARCHALPAVAEHSAQQWPEIVAHMAKRAGLEPQESQAVLAYVLAAQAE